eukprot:PhF_6_TR1079/c1_g4_i3/m.2314
MSQQYFGYARGFIVIAFSKLMGPILAEHFSRDICCSKVAILQCGDFRVMTLFFFKEASSLVPSQVRDNSWQQPVHSQGFVFRQTRNLLHRDLPQGDLSHQFRHRSCLQAVAGKPVAEEPLHNSRYLLRSRLCQRHPRGHPTHVSKYFLDPPGPPRKQKGTESTGSLAMFSFPGPSGCTPGTGKGRQNSPLSARPFRSTDLRSSMPVKLLFGSPLSPPKASLPCLVSTVPHFETD